MATSIAVSQGDLATASQYNDLRTDVLSTHNHDGTDGNATLAPTTISSQVNFVHTSGFTIGSDVGLSRSAANQLDLASEDSLRLVAGDLTVAATATGNHFIRVNGSNNADVVLNAGATGLATLNWYEGGTAIYRARYDTANDVWKFASTDIDGGGSDSTVFEIADGTNDVQFYGGISTYGGVAPTAGLRIGADVLLSRGAANRLDLGSGDSLRISATGELQIAASVTLLETGGEPFSKARRLHSCTL